MRREAVKVDAREDEWEEVSCEEEDEAGCVRDEGEER